MSQMTRFPTLFLLASGALLAQHSYTASDIEDGGRLYRVHCVNCHGLDGNALPNADLGKAMLEAAQLALFTTSSERLTLIPRDTAGTAEGAASAAKSAIADGAQLILGPLLAAEVDKRVLGLCR